MAGNVIYLVRHGEATSKDTNPKRPLTETGADDVSRMAAWAASVGVDVKDIRHSGKLRAEQTANILAKHLNAAPPRATAGLSPNDDVVPVAEALELETGPIMLVGHLPFLDRLASLLLSGNRNCKTITMDAGALVALSKHDDVWTAHCVMQPRLLPQS